MSGVPPEPAVRVEARRLRAAGFALARVPAGKGAVVRGWTTRSAEPAEFLPTDNLGIQGGALSHGNRPGHAAIILDLDAMIALASAAAHLPATGMADGRAGKPRSHLVYLVPLDSIPPWACSTAEQGAAAAVASAGHPGPFLKSFRHRETGVEAIRFLGTGGQATFPPSVWVSADGTATERREWVGGQPGEAAVVPFPVLWQSVCELAAACGCAIPEFLPRADPKLRPSSFQAGDVRGRAAKYLARMVPAVSGQGGHAKTFAAARAVVYGFDLGVEESLALLLAEFNPRCSPPWSEADLRHKVEDADRCPSERPRGWIRDADRTDRMTTRTPAPAQPRPVPPLPPPVPSRPSALNPGPPAPPSPPAVTGGADDRVEILVTADLHTMADAVLSALADRDGGLFQRGGRLVHVLRGSAPPAFLVREAPGVTVEEVGPDHLAVRVSRVCRFVQVRETAHGPVLTPKLPPERVVRAAAAIPLASIRALRAVVTAPTIRPDGSLLIDPGYDPATGLYFAADDCPGVDVPDAPTPAEACEALETLLYPFADFPFAEGCDRASAVAAVLTLVARHAFAGCTPLFLIDGNRAGTGKGKLADVIITIAVGTHPGSMANTTDDVEMRKRLVAIAQAGEQAVKIDNIGEADGLGTASLDSAVTAGVVSDRLLGGNEYARLSLDSVFFGTGNNVRLLGDMPRRVCRMRLETSMENPEERPNLREPRLVEHVRGHRAKYLSAALTVLRAWYTAGCPREPLPTWGSFEAWSDVVRQCVVWLGLPDPYDTRRHVLADADPAGRVFRTLVANWSAIACRGIGLTAARILDAVGRSPDDPEEREKLTALRAAVLELCPGRGTDLPSPKTLGRKLAGLRGRVASGFRLTAAEDRNGVLEWAMQVV